MRLGYECIVKDKRILISIEESDDPVVTLHIQGCEVIRFKASEKPENLEVPAKSEMHDEIEQIGNAVHDAYLKSINDTFPGLSIYSPIERNKI